jgi:hypothetical protein
MLGISFLIGLVFGLAPGLAASKTNMNDALKEGGRRASGGAHDRRFRHAFVIGEVAVALVLLVGAGLMIQSLLRLRRVDPGFRPENVLAADISLPGSRYQNGCQVLNFQRQLLEQVAALPGVRSVGAAAYLSFSGTNNAVWRTTCAAMTSSAWPVFSGCSVRSRPHACKRMINACFTIRRSIAVALLDEQSPAPHHGCL